MSGLAGVGSVALGSPPSTYAGHDVVTGKPGAIPKFATLTVMRAALIAPGLYAAGIRGRKLASGSLLASVGVSAFVVGYCWWKLEPEEKP
jgi:hypothetical protein